MLLAEMTFRPKGLSAKRTTELEDRVESFLAALMRNGQIGRRWVWGWVEGQLKVTVSTPRPDGLSQDYFINWAKEDFARLCAACAGRPSFKVLDDRARKRYPDWRKAETLYLFTHRLDMGSAIHSGKDGTAFPAYLFPFDERQVDAIYFWQGCYHGYEAVWLSGQALEISAYRELAHPSSDLAIDGREVCGEIEALTGLPTYYYLIRYWGRRQGEEERPCPGCGEPWAQQADPESRGLEWFDFLCRECRLVSHVGSCDDDQRYAAIGDWPATRRT